MSATTERDVCACGEGQPVCVCAPTIMRQHEPLCSVEECGRVFYAKSYCRKYYSRFMRNGHPTDRPGTSRVYRRTDIRERLEALIEKTDTCWLWTGHLNNKGYGATMVGRSRVYAHRLSYLIYVGPIPTGLCRVTACVNPAHLEPVTHAENMRRTWRSACRRGHELTPQNVYIRPDNGHRQCRECIRLRQRRAVA